ncbi:MAG: hypothetical protein MJK13_02555 [Pseudomonadales bacterium]|nr:hypothetical protein [Pseudomonadales bacterium]
MTSSSSTTFTKTITILTLIATVVSIMAAASLIVQLYFDIENLNKEISGLNETKSIQAIEIKELKKEIIILNNQLIVLKNQQG